LFKNKEAVASKLKIINEFKVFKISLRFLHL
jgi:hypothetical protein